MSIRDLGEHRLKDLSRPEQIGQLVIAGLPDQFPALKTLTNLPNNLPLMLTSFVPGLMIERGITFVWPPSACTTP